jgi:hypothetical protein
MKMKKKTLKHLLKLLLIPNDNGLEILVIALKTIFLDLKISDLFARLKPLLLAAFLSLLLALKISEDYFYYFKTIALLSITVLPNNTIFAFTIKIDIFY